MLEALLIYYNPHHKCFYSKYVTTHCNYEVGYINSYDHILVQVLLFRENRLVNAKSWIDNYYTRKDNDLKRRKSFKYRAINHLVDLLVYIQKK